MKLGGTSAELLLPLDSTRLPELFLHCAHKTARERFCSLCARAQNLIEFIDEPRYRPRIGALTEPDFEGRIFVERLFSDLSANQSTTSDSILLHLNNLELIAADYLQARSNCQIGFMPREASEIATPRESPVVAEAQNVSKPRRGLTGLQQDVINVLKASTEPLIAKEIAKAIGDGTTEAAIRKRILRMREAGWDIEMHSSCGYSVPKPENEVPSNGHLRLIDGPMTSC